MINIQYVKRNPSYSRIPWQTLTDIYAYVDEKRDVGHSLKSILSNDLFQAYRHADSETRDAMPDIVAFIFSEVRSDCYGSKEKVDRWLTEVCGRCGSTKLRDRSCDCFDNNCQ